jgi:hypothetical protein
MSARDENEFLAFVAGMLRWQGPFQENFMAVDGIGGIFFRAEDPDALRQWYRVNLGVVFEGYTPW